jgi:aminodeoxyfutalosine deaminase
MDSELRASLRRLPKAELHLHLEGSVTPELLLEMSLRQGAPYGLRTLADCEEVYLYDNFPGFLNAIKIASLHLQSPDDYGRVVTNLAHHLASQGVVYAEVFVSIGILHWKKMPVQPVWHAIEAARMAAEARTGVKMAWIFDAVRQFGAGHLERVVDEAILRMSSGPVVGIGIGGDEIAGPASWFVQGYRRARQAGLHLTAHAGETDGPASVWSALRDLDCERIGHGLRAIEDPQLVQYLASSEIFLDICPSSNHFTRCVAEIGEHPAHKYYDSSVRFSISSDDPAVFRTSVLREFEILHDALGFSADELIELVRNSFRGSFLPEADKARWLKRVEAELRPVSPRPLV